VKPTKLILPVLASFVVSILAMQARPRPASVLPSVEDEIKGLEQKANAAYEANDLPRYFSFYAADFSQFLPEGRTNLEQYKKDWTAYIGEGNRVQKVELSDMHVQIGPGKDTAVASYLIHVRTRLKDGKITDEDNQESDVLFKRNGEWKVVFLHYSTAPKK
jgi:ketosteroid isomerase-like protein